MRSPLGKKLILSTFQLDALVLVLTVRRTRASSQNVGKISCLPSKVVNEENLSPFHVYRSN